MHTKRQTIALFRAIIFMPFLMSLGLLSAQDRPNVLFIAVDDLRPTLGCYGDETMLANNGTPRIDSLADQGMVFLNHHVALPICGASRVSLTTGLMPDEHGVLVFSAMRHPTDGLPNVVTLPQHFKNNGYTTAARGKFHDGRTVGDTTQPLQTAGNGDEQYPNGNNIDDPASWSLPFEGAFSGASGVGKTGNPVFYVAPNSATLVDTHTAEVAEDLLDTLEAGSQPFFLAIGFAKPHLPFDAHERFWDIHDTNNNGRYDDDLDLPEFPMSPANAPGSFSWVGELASYDDFATNTAPTDPAMIREMRHGYYAGTSMIDEYTGDILDYLATKDDPVQVGKKMDETTIIVFWGDHGFALGEHNRWAKHIDDELSSWAPLIIYDPRSPGNGAKTMAPVSSLDIYPTLCELAGLPLPTQPIDNVTPTGRPLRGRSLVPMLEDPVASVNGGALIHKWIQGTTFIYRTDQYRLLEDYSGNTVTERQLYDLGTNRVEKVNVAGDPAYAGVLHELSMAMRSEASAQAVGQIQNSAAAPAPSDRGIRGVSIKRAPSGTDAALSWPSSSGSGSAYTVLFSTDLPPPFSPLTGSESVTGGSVEVPTTAPRGFYQVELDDNRAPYFTVDPIMGDVAVLDENYSASLDGTASDDGTVTYAKVAGPSWLSVAANGALTGTPLAADDGANYFTISASDTEGAVTQAKLYILVDDEAPAPTVTTIVFDDFDTGVGNLTSYPGGNANGFWSTPGGIVESSGDFIATVDSSEGNFKSVNQLSSSSGSSDWNFFDQEITLQVRELSWDGTTGTGTDLTPIQMQTWFAFLTDQPVFPNGNDGIILDVRADGRVRLKARIDGSYLGSGGGNSFDEISVSNITGFDFTLGPTAGTGTDYTITLYGDTTETTSGNLASVTKTDWWNGNGFSRLGIWNQETDGGQPGVGQSIMQTMIGSYLIVTPD